MVMEFSASMEEVDSTPIKTHFFDPQIHRESDATGAGSWVVCQIGAREHYAIARALLRRQQLAELLTDFWVPPGHAFGAIPGGSRLRDRFHRDMVHAKVWAPNLRMLGFEAVQRVQRRDPWQATFARNAWFQKRAVRHLRQWEKSWSGEEAPTLFSYSYAALGLFKHAKEAGWKTVLGQIDPGPEEERLVGEEHRRYRDLATSWQPVPPIYWERWREEVELADRIVVNSPWSRDCLLKEGVSASKMQVIPLVYEAGRQDKPLTSNPGAEKDTDTLKVLFLGQINLRKGIGRLLDAMKRLKGKGVFLTLVGPSEIDPKAWEGLDNVRWVGPVPRSLAMQRYDQADLFILPTLSDGYALTQLEALSRGVPVLASRHCGQAVTEGKGGWILEDLEPDAICDRLLELATIVKSRRNPEFIASSPSAGFTLDSLADALLTPRSPR